jgi:ATP-binding cassette subfamily B protein
MTKMGRQDGLVGIRQVRRIWSLLGRRRQLETVGLVAVQTASSVLDVLSLGVVLPFVAALTDPDGVRDFPGIDSLASAFGAETSTDLANLLAVLFIAVVTISSGARLASLWVTTRLSQAIANDMIVRAFDRVLHQPYEFHIRRRAGEMLSVLLGKVDMVALAVVRPILTLTGGILTTVMVTAALLAISPAATLIVVAGVSIGYGGVGLLARRHLNRNSEVLVSARSEQFRAADDTLGGIRDVLLDGSQTFFIERFRRIDSALRRVGGSNAIIGSGPRFALEPVALVTIAVIALWLNRGEDGFVDSLATLGVIALGGMRLLPALQQCFAAWTAIEGSRAVIDEAMEYLAYPDLDPVEMVDPLPFSRELWVRGVAFRYEAGSGDVLADVDLTIVKGRRIGIVGPTGEGKSTFLDMLMGLLEPSEGEILVDGSPMVGMDRVRWMRSVAHVPQQVVLADMTIRENISFGVDGGLIDESRLQMAVEIAQLQDVVASRPGGLDEVVGAGGVRLSGGQRQRLGIARALYRQADVLILDEATSALDVETEGRVIEGIRSLGEGITIIQVSHRLSTIAGCDLVIEIADGGIRFSGTYEEFLAREDDRQTPLSSSANADPEDPGE